MTDLPFRRATLPIEERVADLLFRLTLEEKVGQLTQFFHLGIEVPEGLDVSLLPPEQRAYAEQPTIVESAIRDGLTGSILFVKDAATANRMQRLAVEESPLGVPLLFGFDVIHGLRTIFPVPLALAATWSPQTIEAVQATAARETRAVGIHWTFAPMVDVARDPRWGRIIEGAGEDPVLGAAIAAAQVRGFQGSLGPDSILAGPKHFAGYGASRGGRDYDDADISDSELWNVYLPPFRAAIDSGAATVMTAYMDYNGVPASGNRRLLSDVLRNGLGFTGFVVSDNNAVRSLETQHFAKDLTDAAVRAVTAGVDMEMCMVDPAFSRLAQAVRDGLVGEEVINDAVSRILKVKFELGLFESPYVDEEAAAVVLAGTESRDLACSAAEASLVLLKNDAGALPLAASSLTSVAVIGQLADSKRDTLGPWVFDHDTKETVTILEGLRSRLGDTVNVVYAPGAGIPERIFPSMFDQMDSTVVATQDDYDDAAEIRTAVQLAAESDIAIVVVGQRQNQIGENASTSTLEMPGAQEEQLRQIVKTGTPVVLVVMSGRPLDLRWADANVPAILQAWYPGTRGGDAVASVLFGDTSPAGRLPFTWPRHVGQVPMVYSHYRTFAPQDQQARYWEESSTPLYPFGHGLSYATFDYANLQLDRGSIGVGESVTATVEVTNTSASAAEEVVQLYIHQRYGTSSRPVRELKAFERVKIAAGERRTVEFTLGPDQLQYWSAVTGGYVQDATTIDVWVGGSSTAELTTVLDVTDSAPAATSVGWTPSLHIAKA
ncbi:glycoside hydrolase family 3 N-terminal domain-containing protein [Arthrobacter sp. SLBN-100]|uniref:glycoside hydrolase family 3 N-terminal domain-containing protein n=1 Tax=Arthrobacter sp. SLBN-100 TaxID=2768450 RepID=UPI00114D9C42|nr:glycoside hydrolase family 3 N-terminal domain-containing protein [Arthrobacter sp. SLBN-100]